MRPNVRDKDMSGLKRDILVDLTVGLSCPVQGYPAPTFRYAVFENRGRAFFRFDYFERIAAVVDRQPTGNVAPRIAGYEGGNLVATFR